ncbi:hypothetical protein [Actibacterium lipolyticum]|uniref:Uncharacterized protein n=1 Tax=Actibacterium lipolyticum TaxID=1524263 RepID=A0A238JQT8_9RHOB|nr:hypothetical protein [Actibacterium lipolyticum]SMX33021.1 hypothetical protein COL8621_00940 [Actibacterium lipolyticum]
MDDIQVAVDEAQAGLLVSNAQALLGTLADSGTSSLGPFNMNWNASTFFSGGSVDLRTPDIVRIANMDMNFTVGIGFSIDIGDFLPDFCIPQICIPIPFFPDICTPEICITWPTIPVGPISHSGTVSATADFRLLAMQDGTDWLIEIEIVDIPSLSLDAASTAIGTALIAALSLALLQVPFIGPFLAGLTVVLGAIFAVSAITGLLGPILSLFLAGLTFEIYRQPQVQQVLPPMGAFDPAVSIRIDTLGADVQATDEDELVISANISAA